MKNDLKSIEALKAYAREVLCGNNPTNTLLISKKHFKGKCPYTDKKCEDWRCQDCEVEAAERKYMENDSEE